jgi:diguanylate cyclase (GGDEF)-like protein
MTAMNDTTDSPRTPPAWARWALRIVASGVLGTVLFVGGWGAVEIAREIGATRATRPHGMLEGIEAIGVLVVFALGLLLPIVFAAWILGARRRSAEAHRREVERLQRVALSDNLTGLRNRRAFQEDLGREIECRNRSGICFSLLMIDLDGLKEVNDNLGHQAGDDRICAAAECLESVLRDTDCAYRIGGDEFIVILRGERAWGALSVARRLHAAAGVRPIPVSFTVGIAESVGTESRDTLVRQADLALYEAKREGIKTLVFRPGLAGAYAARLRRVADPSRRTYQQSLATALARAVDAKDAGTRNHCETVAELCAMIATNLGFAPDHVRRVRLAGLVHDVGKIGIADAILQKPESLAFDERHAMREHVVIGHSIVAAAQMVEEASWILHHHEHFDGSGYPDRLSGEAIPLESRIILVADAFEAITADRPYRLARSPDEALEELATSAGTQFDPACVQALFDVLGFSAFPHQVGTSVQELAAWRAERQLDVSAPPPSRRLDPPAKALP